MSTLTVDGEWDSVAVYGHVVCVGGRVDLLASSDVGVLESVLFLKLEEYPVVHSSERTLEVRVGCVYVSS